MNKYTLILKHPMFGFARIDVGAFTAVRARQIALKQIGAGYKQISLTQNMFCEA